MVRRLLDEGFAYTALEFLDETCEEETFRRALAYPFVREPPKFLYSMDTMKALGYKREMLLWTASEEIFRKMVEEHSNATAKRHVYEHVLERSSCWEFKRFVGLEAKAKGVKIQAKYVFSGMRYDKALSLALEICDEGQAYQAALDCTIGPESIVSVLKQAVEAGWQ
ncbi:hypothetical protein SELMODRAFT_418919 [Selaginella moellendorffii]|uniref:Uncharacterized protein n=1 Tax=Selaginella moellendorffii TaxID=88036 RepID=D8S784_SELML|nr:hypothetical protein SELMODRAFT_418919 [Selaginella moellendorffii]